jgi:hypothetical protein
MSWLVGEGSRNVTDTHDVPPQVRQNIQLATADDRWNRAYEKARRTRLQRVQASARVWLGVLTTLFGLLGSVVLFKGGDLVTGVTANGWFQAALILLVGLVFVSAILAMIAGGAATWGGLDDLAPSADVVKGMAVQSTVLSAKGQTDDKRPGRQQFFGFFLLFALESKADRKRLRAIPRPPGRAAAERGEAAWQIYKEGSLNSADRRRALLHASRNLGVVAASLIAVLAIVATIAGTVSPAPSEVIVVYHGRFSCVPAADSAKYTGVTQVVPVNSC